MTLQKRDCGIGMELSIFAGWTDVYLTVGNERLCFIITSSYGHQFDDFLRVLYHLYPRQDDPENADHLIEHKIAVDDKFTGKTSIYDGEGALPPGTTYRDIPFRAEFSWDEEGSRSNWRIEREPTEETDFMLNIEIEVCRADTKTYTYQVRYKDLCYAVAKACTEALKKYGFYGYHNSIYFSDFNVRYLLFFKSIALDCFDARELTYAEGRAGEYSALDRELELLLFDM